MIMLTLDVYPYGLMTLTAQRPTPIQPNHLEYSLCWRNCVLQGVYSHEGTLGNNMLPVVPTLLSHILQRHVASLGLVNHDSL